MPIDVVVHILSVVLTPLDHVKCQHLAVVPTHIGSLWPVYHVVAGTTTHTMTIATARSSLWLFSGVHSPELLRE